MDLGRGRRTAAEEEEAEGHQAEEEAGGGLGPLQLAVASLWPVAGAAEGGGHRLDAEYLTLTLVCFQISRVDLNLPLKTHKPH